MAKIKTHYDKERDVFYVSSSSRFTRNLPWTLNEDICLNPETFEVVGYIITNFRALYPNLVKRYNPAERWFVVDFFEERLKDWNRLLAPLQTWKARVNFLTREQATRSHRLVHH